VFQWDVVPSGSRQGVLSPSYHQLSPIPCYPELNSVISQVRFQQLHLMVTRVGGTVAVMIYLGLHSFGGKKVGMMF
jgi:hypothetical protein